jgi:hypothetical protein
VRHSPGHGYGGYSQGIPDNSQLKKNLPLWGDFFTQNFGRAACVRRGPIFSSIVIFNNFELKICAT